MASKPKLGMSQAMGGRREEIFRIESQLTKFSHPLLALIAQLPRGDSAAQAECDGQGDSRMAIGIVELALCSTKWNFEDDIDERIPRISEGKSWRNNNEVRDHLPTISRWLN